MRRRYLVHPAFQMQFTLFFVMGLVAVLLILGGVGVGILLYASHCSFLSGGQQQLLAMKAHDLFWILLSLAGILSGCFLFLGLYLSFKLMGPLNRIEVWLERLLHGHNPLPLQIRPKDELKGITAVLNQIREKMKINKED